MAVAFQFAQLLEDPIFLGSFGLALVGWIVALAGQCASDLRLRVVPDGPFTWFILFFNLFVIVITLMAVGSNRVNQYRPALMAFFSASFVFDSIAVQTFIHRDSSYQAAGAGYIFLSIVYVVWIILLGSENSGAVKSGYPASGMVIDNSITPTMIPLSQTAPQNNVNQVVVSPNAEYAYKARALYDYSASPEDPNELNFSKDEVLDIVDNKGKWWQARRPDGVIGIVPSNYLQII